MPRGAGSYLLAATNTDIVVFGARPLVLITLFLCSCDGRMHEAVIGAHMHSAVRPQSADCDRTSGSIMNFKPREPSRSSNLLPRLG